MTSVARVLILASLVLAFSLPAFADEAEVSSKPKVMQVSYSSPNTRVSAPNTVSLELVGRAMLWSVNYDHAFGEQAAAGFGFGSVGTEFRGVDANQTAAILPVYFNFYFMKSEGSLYATGGLNMILNSSKVKGLTATTSDVTFRKDAIMPTIGLGYEYRADGGFLVRGAGYALFGDEVKPWVGVSFGMNF